MPTSTQLMVTRHNISDRLYRALFVSELQQSDDPTASMVAQAITDIMRRFGTDGCVGQMAQEFGDHRDAASERMRWVRQLAARAGLPGGPPAMKLPKDGKRHERDMPPVRTRGPGGIPRRPRRRTLPMQTLHRPTLESARLQQATPKARPTIPPAADAQGRCRPRVIPPPPRRSYTICSGRRAGPRWL